MFLREKDLCKYLKPLDGTLPHRGGRKEYAPDGTWLQKKKLETLLIERKAALSEQKCPRIGSLSIGEWLPDEGRIKVNKEMGKMWATMGYVEEGIKYLDLEEALFLIDEGQMEVYYEGIPLSLQEAYGAFFGNRRLFLEQYQVYAYLLRIGYICRKFKEINNPTSYEKKIGLDKYVRDTASKRKFVASTGPENHVETDEKNTEQDHFAQQDYQKKVRVGKEASECVLMDTDKSGGTFMEKGNKILSCSNHSHQNEMISHSDVRSLETRKISNASEASCSSFKAYSNWDYEMITFPNIANRSELEIKAPTEHLLPCSVHLSKKKYMFNVQSMRNNTQIRSQDEQLNFSVSSAHWKARIKAVNWADYKSKVTEILSSGEYLQNWSPVCHLWKEGYCRVQPLVNPVRSKSTGHILEALNVIQKHDPCQKNERLQNKIPPIQIHYNVYRPDSKFKKTEERKPAFRISVCRMEDCIPDFGANSRLLSTNSDGVPVFWAVVDNGSTTFYSFNFTELSVE